METQDQLQDDFHLKSSFKINGLRVSFEKY